MAGRLWKETTKRSKNKWMNPNAMLLAGIAGVKLLTKIGDKNATKKYKDIAAETAWLLWKIRNERTIGGKTIKKEEVKKRWMKAMKNMIEDELGRTKEKETKEKREKDTKEFLKRWETKGLVIKKKEDRIKIQKWGEDW